MPTASPWPDSAYPTLDALSNGTLAFGEKYFRHILLKPELAPIPESCDAELALYERLSAAPLSALSEADIGTLADPDAQENYRVFTRYRNHCLAAPDVASAYVRFFQGEGVSVPPVFLYELAQALIEHQLQKSSNAFHWRMAEAWSRPQKITVLSDKSVMMADHAIVERLALTAGFGNLGELLRKQNLDVRSIDLDVLHEDNASTYFERSMPYDMAVSLNSGGDAQAALAHLISQWIAAFFGTKVKVSPKSSIDDGKWRWHIGLTAEASRLLNKLYEREELTEEEHQRLLCLFELRFDEDSLLIPDMAGKPIYLALAMDEHQMVRLKPQNLLLNLPLRKT